MGSFRSEWTNLVPTLMLIAGLFTAGLILWGIASWRWYVQEGRTSLTFRSSSVRLPLFVVGMSVSIAVNSRTQDWIWPYFVTGAIWALSYPLRFTVGHALIKRERKLYLLRHWPVWWIALVLTPIYVFGWPLAVPALFLASSESGMAYMSEE